MEKRCTDCSYCGKCYHNPSFLQIDCYIEECFYEKCMEKVACGALLLEWIDSKSMYMKYTSFSRSDFGNYSRHDYTHSLAILNAITSVLGKNKIKLLNATDLWLLLHCAYGHDIGMPIPFNNLLDFWAKMKHDTEFGKFFQDALLSEDIDLQNAAKFINSISDMIDVELVNGTGMSTRVDKSELGTKWPAQVYRYTLYLTAEFVRRNHAKRSQSMIESCELFKKHGNAQVDSRFYKLIAKCCYAHACECEEVLNIGKTESDVETDVCHPRFVAFMLRLGDLLDISNNRFDYVDLMHYGDLGEISALHKKKHESIEHILYTEKKIEITAHSDDENVCKLANDWFGMINREVLFIISHWAEFAPEELGGCTLSMPVTKVYLNDDIFYRVEDCQFKVDKSTLIELVIGRNLYKSEFDFLREYVQNALDATKMKFWIDICNGNLDYFIHNELKLKKKNRSMLLPFDFASGVYGQYTLEIVCDYKEKVNSKSGEKEEVVSIELIDKGIGIDKECIDAISNIGSGWKKRKKYAEYLNTMPMWLKPTGGFGIGMQSGFMITDAIQIETKCENEPKGRKIGLYSEKKDGRIEERDYPVYTNGTKVSVEVPYKWFMDVENYKDYAELNIQKNNIDFMEPSKTMNWISEFIRQYLEKILGNTLFPIMVRRKGQKPIKIQGFSSDSYGEGEKFQWEGENYKIYNNHGKMISIWDSQKGILCHITLSEKSDDNLSEEWYFKGVRVWVDEQEGVPAKKLYRYIGNFKIDIMGMDVSECLTVDRNRFRSGFDYGSFSDQYAIICLNYLAEKRLMLQEPVVGRTLLRNIVAYKYLDDSGRKNGRVGLDAISDTVTRNFVALADMLIYQCKFDNDSRMVVREKPKTLYDLCNGLFYNGYIAWGMIGKEGKAIQEFPKWMEGKIIWDISDKTSNKIVPLLQCALETLYIAQKIECGEESYIYFYDEYSKNKSDNAIDKEGQLFELEQGKRQIFCIDDDSYFSELHVRKIPFHTEDDVRRLKMRGKHLIISPIPAVFSDEDAIYSLRDKEDQEESYIKMITDNKIYQRLIDWVYMNQETPELYSRENIEDAYNKLVKNIFDTFINGKLSKL